MWKYLFFYKSVFLLFLEKILFEIGTLVQKLVSYTLMVTWDDRDNPHWFFFLLCLTIY